MTPEQLEKELKKLWKAICCNTGGSSTITSEDSSTIDFSGDGTIDTPLTASVISEVVLGDYVKSYRRNKRFDYFNDFISAPNSGSTVSNDLLITFSGGVNFGLNPAPTYDNTHIGVLTLQSPSSSTGFGSIMTGTNALMLGGGAWDYEQYLNVLTLSTGTNRYNMLIGFLDPNGISDSIIDGVFFLYDEGATVSGAAASPNWQIVTASASTRTYTTTSVAVTAGSWTKLRININAAATSVDFYINGVLVGTHTTNIPGTGRYTGFGMTTRRTIGSGTPLVMDLDYISVQCDFTIDR